MRGNSYCSKGKRVCQGQPCYAGTTTTTTTTPMPVIRTTTAGMSSTSACRTGWSDWINTNHPKEGGDAKDVEPIPNRVQPVVDLIITYYLFFVVCWFPVQDSNHFAK